MKKITTLAIAFAMTSISIAQDTFSIIAVDPVTGDIGSAGATCISSAGGSNIADIITDIIPGRGGVNSQAYVCIPNVNLQNAIIQMDAGLSPSEIIDYLLANDACNSQNYNPDYRQYGIVDLDEANNPRAAGWTGPSTDDYKEDRQGANFSIQGNILLNQSVIDNMEANFNNTAGTLADKLMAAMQGANFPGADSRCLGNGTSSRTAYLLVYHADDLPGEPYLRLLVPVQPIGVEPIDLLQNMYDTFLTVEDNLLKNSLKLYPNPTENTLSIAVNAAVHISEYKVFDINGQLVLQYHQQGNESFNSKVDVSKLQAGLYIMKISSNQGDASFKFVKQ